MKALDFNTLKKSYMTVTLADEKQTVLMIGTPTKGVMDALTAIQSNLSKTDDENSVEAMNDLYTACAKVMSRNKAGKKITAEYLADIFDYEDITLFFNAYMEFISEISATKNS